MFSSHLNISPPGYFVERPIRFLQELKNIQVQEGNGVTLCCELSKPGPQAQWKRGDDVLTNGEKYQMKQSGSALELLIRKSQPEDSGIYSCVCDDIKTTATIIITGESHYISVWYIAASLYCVNFSSLWVIPPQQSQ